MKDLKLNNGFIAGLLILVGLFCEWAAIAGAVFILYNGSNEWLKKMMARLLVVIFAFYIVSAGVGILEQVIFFLKKIVKLPTNLTYNMIAVATLLKYCYMGWMALKAYKGKVFTVQVIEKIVDKIYQPVTDQSLYKKDGCCPNCGNIWNEGDLFCQKCGTRRN